MGRKKRDTTATADRKNEASVSTHALGAGVQVEDLFALLKPVVSLLGSLVGQHLEVVLHDLTTPTSSVMAIANGHVSKRQVGDPILSGPRGDAGFRELHKHVEGTGRIDWSLIEKYQTTNAAGQRLHSATLLFRDGKGTPVAALCLNADMTVFEMAYGWLEQMLHRDESATQNAPPSDDVDLKAMMQGIIDDAVRYFMKPPELMNKKERMYAVEAMMQRGLFLMRNSVTQVADALGVSRFTIYNYIDQIKQRTVPSQGSNKKKRKRPPAAPH